MPGYFVSAGELKESSSEGLNVGIETEAASSIEQGQEVGFALRAWQCGIWKTVERMEMTEAVLGVCEYVDQTHSLQCITEVSCCSPLVNCVWSPGLLLDCWCHIEMRKLDPPKVYRAEGTHVRRQVAYVYRAKPFSLLVCCILRQDPEGRAMATKMCT